MRHHRLHVRTVLTSGWLIARLEIRSGSPLFIFSYGDSLFPLYSKGRPLKASHAKKQRPTWCSSNRRKKKKSKERSVSGPEVTGLLSVWFEYSITTFVCSFLHSVIVATWHKSVSTHLSLIFALFDVQYPVDTKLRNVASGAKFSTGYPN